MNTVDFIHKCPYCTIDEYNTLKSLGFLFEENITVIMIGAGPGELLMSFLEGFRFDKCNCHVVDIQTCQYTQAHIEANTEIRQKLKNINYIVDSSENFSKIWSGLIDLLIVDGDHTVEGVLTDIRCWLPYVKNHGYVWFHDYEFNENVGLTKFDTGVKDAVESVRSEYSLCDVVKVGCSLMCRVCR